MTGIPTDHVRSDRDGSDEDGLDQDRLDQLVVLLAERLQGENTYSATMLDKALLLTETLAYIERGRAVTGALYHRRTWGPSLPQLPAVQDRLVGAGAAELAERRVGGKVVRRLVPRVGADASAFSAEELRDVDVVVAACRRLGSRGASDLGGRMPGWRCAVEGAVMPFAAALIHEGPLADADRHVGTEPMEDVIADRAEGGRLDQLRTAVQWLVARSDDRATWPELVPEVSPGIRLARAAVPGGSGPVLRMWFRGDDAAAVGAAVGPQSPASGGGWLSELRGGATAVPGG